MTQINPTLGREQLRPATTSDFSNNNGPGVPEGSARPAKDIVGDITDVKEYKVIPDDANSRAYLVGGSTSLLNIDDIERKCKTKENEPSEFKLLKLLHLHHRAGVDTLLNEHDVWPKAQKPQIAEYAIARQLPRMPSGISMATLDSSLPVGTQTDAPKNSAVHRYGALVASSLSAILGAVLVIVAKTHGQDDIDMEGAADIVPQEPDYNALSAQASEQAEQAFYDKWQDPDKWGPGKVNSAGENLETGERNEYFTLIQTGADEYGYSDSITPEGQRTLDEVKQVAADTAVAQARADYQQALEEAGSHNNTHPEGQHFSNDSGKDHDAMFGIGATLIGVGSLAATLIGGNKLTHHSHNKQAAQGIPVEHGAMKNFVEQHLFRIKP